jgi:PAS domain S-box-containing protein
LSTPEAWVLKQRIHEHPEVAVARFLARFIAGHSIRSLTHLVTVCVTAPVLVLVLYLGQQYVVEKKGEVAAKAMELARLFSQRHGDTVLQARTLLETLACQPNLVDIPAHQLHAQFLRIAKANPQYAHLSLAGPDGLLIASSASTDAVIDYNDRMQFRGAMQEKRFVVGEAVVSRTTGQPILPFGAPVIGPDGRGAGVLLLGLLLDEYDRFFAGLRLSEGVRFLLFDEQGTRLLRYPRSDGAPAGQQLFPPAWEVIAKAAEDVMTFSMKDPAGRDVTYACIRFRVGPGEGGRLGVLAGIPTPGFADLFWPVYGRSLLLVLAAMAVSIVLGGVLTDRVVGVGLETLTREVDQVAAGKYPPMPVSLAGCREVQALGASFLVMADALARDQEARDLAERHLQAESLRFKTLLEAATDGVHILDTDGRLVLWSPSFAEMLGYSMEAMAGMRLCDWYMQCSGTESSAEIQAIIENQKSFETRYRRKDGAILDVEVSARGVALDGRTFLYASARDVTWRKQAQAALRESETNFRLFFESMHDMIWVASLQGNILFTNKAVSRTLGYTSEEIQSMHMLEAHPEGMRQEAEAILAAIFRGERTTCPLPLARKDGGLVPVETTAWLGRWSGENCIFGISKNLTAEQEAHQRFERLFRSNPALMALSTFPERRFVDVNDAFVAVTGRARSEVVGKTPVEIGLFAQPETQLKNLEVLAAKHSVRSQEVQILCGDGALRDGFLSMELISSQGRQYILSVLIDITERKQAEQALRDAERRYRELVEHAPIGIFQAAPDGRYTKANSRLAEMYGYGSVREMQDTDHLGAQLFVEPGECGALLRRLDRMPVIGAESCRRRKDGSSIWVALSVRAVRDGAGAVLHYEGFVVDISAVKKAQEALRESEERYRAFFESAESIKLILEPADGAIMEANRAAVDFYGYNREQLLRMAMPHLNAEPREDFLAKMARAATREKTVFHLQHRLANGDIRDVECYVSPVRHGGRLLVMCSLQDVTELRRLERVREDVERIIRHDLKSPLNGLINIPLLLLEGKNLNAEQRELLAVVATAGRKMLNQINCSLEMYKIESASYLFQPTPCAPVKILRDNAALLTLSMGLDPDRIRLWTHGLGGTGEVASFQSDPVLLDLIMMNLLRNALEASGPQEPVLVDVSTDDGMLVISIANSQSVPQEMRQCFFEKYATAGKVGGTGLGTYSAAIMTHAIGGVITMETSEAHGTKVTVRLPLTPTPANGSL